jgi:excisionase family DNA binding protein
VPEKFFSFEQALRELNLREEELKRLVSEGEIRAFRDGDKMKFRKEDVDRISTKSTGAGGETVADAEDLIFDEEDGLELEEEPGMATAPIASQPEEIEEAPPPRPAAAPARSAAPAPAKKTPTRQSRVRQVEVTTGKTSPIMLVLLVVSSLTLLYGVFVMLSAASSTTNSMTKGFADTMYSMGFAQKS